VDKDIIDQFWARDFFNCTVADFRGTQDILCPHSYLSGYNGIFIMKISGKHIISAPENAISGFCKIINRGHDLYEPNLLRTLLEKNFDQCIGPSWIGYPCHEDLGGGLADGTLLMPKGDEKRHALLEQLRVACGPVDWSHCGIDEASECVALLCSDGTALSSASYEKWGEKIAHIGILTHPQYRGRGHAQTVLRTITAYICQQSLVPQYRTLCSNSPAIRAAGSCGFEEYASHISIRLK